VDNRKLTWFGRVRDSDIYYSFIKSPTAIVSTVILIIIFFCSFFVELVTPYNPFDPSSLSLMDAFTPPSWTEDGLAKFILGTDGQGRDMLSTILYGSRISLIVGFSAIIFSLVLGVSLGLTAGYFGGKYEMIVMRLTDVQLTVPSILMALLVDGIARGIISREMHDEMAIYVLIFAIGISEWPQFARVSRAATLVEKNKDYVSASTIIGVSNIIIMFKHILPNILRPVLVIGTIGLALAILAESTLSFLGVGVPPTTPSLGTLIRLGNDFLFSGEWWITFFPAIFLVILAFSINLLGDWMRDTLNPKLKRMVSSIAIIDKIKSKVKEEPINVFNEAINNIKPTVEVRSRRVGGATYQVPVEVKSKRSQALAFRWLIDASRKRKDKKMSDKIFNEIFDAYQNRGSAIKKKEDTHKMAESNKAFAHYRW